MPNTEGPLSSFSLPADQNDFPDDPGKLARLQKRWSWNLEAFTNQAIIGDPWTTEYDRNRFWYYNPLQTEIPPQSPVETIFWTAFPNRLKIYFSKEERSPYGLTTQQVFELADFRKLPDVPAFADGFPNIPGQLCPIIDWGQPQRDWAKYDPLGPRGYLDEYCEWSVSRNEEGKITKVMFTCENPEYWYNLWLVSPEQVLCIYQGCIHPDVRIEDLYLPATRAEQAQGKKWAIDPQTGKPAYNPLNKWNTGTQSESDRGGAMHLTSPPNTIGAETYLAAAATLLRQLSATEYNQQGLICCSQYGRPYRHSDPHIGFQVNQLVKNFGVMVSLTNPVGLYLQRPDFSNYRLPKEAPQGCQPSDFWKILRGRSAKKAGAKYDQILHAQYEVPKELGFTVSDITIGGQVESGGKGSPATEPVPINYGGQIAETFHVALAGTGIAPTKPKQNLLLCPVSKPAQESNGWPLLLLAENVYQAYEEFTPNWPSSLIPPVVHPGDSLNEYALLVLAGRKDATVAFDDHHIQVQVLRSYSGSGAVPGQTSSSSTWVYVINIEIGDEVQTGQKGIRVTNPGVEPGPPIPGFLTVVD